MCERCRGYDRWIERLRAAEAGQPLTAEELRELREHMEIERDDYIDAAGEASWNS